MAIKINWEAAKEAMGGNNYKDYAEAGLYTVKLDTVEIHEVGTNGSIAQDFMFEEGDVKYPKATHWLSFKNDNWRYWHNKCLFETLGLAEDDAKKTVEFCEDGKDKDAIVRNYKSAYAKLAAKHPSIEIEVWQDGKYGRADFTDKNVRMSHPDDKPYEKKEDVMDGAVELPQNDELDLPF